MAKIKVIQGAKELLGRSLGTVASSLRQVKIPAVTLEDLRREYEKESARISSGIKTLTPQRIVVGAAQRGVLGPLPYLATKVGQQVATPRQRIKIGQKAGAVVQMATRATLPVRQTLARIPAPVKAGIPPLWATEKALQIPVAAESWMKMEPWERQVKGWEKAEELTVPYLRKFYPSRIPLERIEKKYGPRVSSMEEIRKRAPAEAFGGELLGDIANLVGLSYLTGGIGNLVKVPGFVKTLSPYTARLLPEMVRGGTTWGLKGLLDEGLEQYRRGVLEPRRLITETGKEAAFGLAITPASVLESAGKRVLALGVSRGAWAALQGYIKDRKIDSEDILNITANAVLGMVFGAIGAKSVTKRFQDQKFYDFNRGQTIIKTGLPQKEAEAVVDTLEKISLAKYGVKYGFKTPPAIYEQIPANLKGISLLPKEQQYKVADSIIDSTNIKVQGGQPLYQALFEAVRNVASQIPIGLTVKEISPEERKRLALEKPAEVPKPYQMTEEEKRMAKEAEEFLGKFLGKPEKKVLREMTPEERRQGFKEIAQTVEGLKEVPKIKIRPSVDALGSALNEFSAWQNNILEPIPKKISNRSVGVITEASMDIGRELSKRDSDMGYMSEKLTKIRKELTDPTLVKELVAPLSAKDIDKTSTLLRNYYEFDFGKIRELDPDKTRALELARDLTGTLAQQDVNSSLRFLDELEPLLVKITGARVPKIKIRPTETPDVLYRKFMKTATAGQIDEAATMIPRLEKLGFNRALLENELAMESAAQAGVEAPMVPIKITPTEKAYEEAELARGRGAIKQAKKEEVMARTGEDLQKILNRMKATKEGEWALPSSIGGERLIWDKIAMALGYPLGETKEIELVGRPNQMVNAELYNVLVELKGGQPGTLGRKEISKLPGIQRQAKLQTLYDRLPPEFFNVVRDWEGRVQAVSVEPTKEIKIKIGRREVAPALGEERMFIRDLARKKSPAGQVAQLAKQIRENTQEAIQRNRITPEQIKLIRQLRADLGILNRELEPIMENVAGEDSLGRMTKNQANQVVRFLQPANWAKIEQEVTKIRTAEMGKRVKMVGIERFTTRYPQLEKQFGAIGALNNTLQRISNIAENIKGAPSIKETIGTLRGRIAPYLPQAPAAEATGIRSTFHVHLRAIIGAVRAYEIGMKKALWSVFDDLTPEEALQVVSIQAGGPKKEISPKLLERANYLQDVFDASLAIHNMLRKARGLAPIPRRQRYISYIIEENLREAGDLYGSVAFDRIRKKTFEEFEAGLFEQDPAKIIDIWSRSSADYLKKDLFGAFLRPRYDEIQELGGQAAIYARQLMEYDIYNMTSLTDRALRSETWLDQKVASIFPKKIPVNKELADAILGTRLNKVLADDVEKGYIKVARFQIPNLATTVHTVFYPAALAWNLGFAILNRTQPIAGVPFIGLKNALAASIKMHSLLLPWNKAERDNYIRILEEGGHKLRQVAAGEQIQTYEGEMPILVFIDSSINFLANATELMNRLESEIGAEKFMDEWAEKTGIKLTQAEKEAVMARFSGFINFMFGAGYAPIAQRSTLGRILYIFQQYPLNQIFDVYTQMYRQAMQDDGARAFWETLRVEAGAGEKTRELFERLPDTSKANVYKIFLALSIPVAIMYVLSGSWNVAERAFPGMPRFALMDMFAALGEWMQDPELNLEALKKQFAATFDPRAIQRLADEIDIQTGGIIQTRTRGTPIFVEKGGPVEASRRVAFGRQTIPEYGEAYPGILQRVIGGITGAGTPAREVTALVRKRENIRQENRERAVQIIIEARKAKTPDERSAVLDRYKTESGERWPDIRDRIKDYLAEEKKGVTPLSRRMQIMDVEDRARLVVSQAAQKKTPEERKAYLDQIKTQGLLTPQVIKEVKRILKEEGVPTKKGGILQWLTNFASGILGKVSSAVPTETALAEEPAPDINTPEGRMAMVFDLYQRGWLPEEIKGGLLLRKDEGWTEKEIDQYLGALGIEIPKPTKKKVSLTPTGGTKKIKVTQQMLTAAGKKPQAIRRRQLQVSPMKITPEQTKRLTIKRIAPPTETYPLRLPRVESNLGIPLRRLF